MKLRTLVLSLIFFLITPLFSLGQSLLLVTSKSDGVYLSNAVRISKTQAIGVAHCVREKDGTLVKRPFKLGGKTAYIGKADADLVLFEIDETIIDPIADVGTAQPTTNTTLTHRYVNVDNTEKIDIKTRQVTIIPYAFVADWSQIKEKFKYGMSGSGLYNNKGELVGLAELSNGVFWNLKSIREFLRLK